MASSPTNTHRELVAGVRRHGRVGIQELQDMPMPSRTWHFLGEVEGLDTREGTCQGLNEQIPQTILRDPNWTRNLEQRVIITNQGGETWKKWMDSAKGQKVP